MSKIVYLQAGSAVEEAVMQGKYVGFYYVLEDSDIYLQIERFMQLVMGKRCDVRPALDISQVNSKDMRMQALRELYRRCRVNPVIYSKTPEGVPAVCDYGYRVWVEDADHDDSDFVMIDQDRLCIVID